MLLSVLLTPACLFAIASAQSVTIITGDTSSSSSSSSSASSVSSASSSSSGYSGVPTGTITDLPTGTYLSYTTTITVSSTSRPAYGSISSSSGTSMVGNATRSSNSTMTSSSSSSSDSLTLLSGRSSTAVSGTANATSTSTSATATNTQACNNYPEFCSRKYSNITMVAAHNSPFVVKNNVASNQAYNSIAQLNDGIRLLQTETHWPNSSAPYLCHTSCDLLNVGTLEAWLTTLNEWVAAHPYDVITLLIGNQDFVSVEDYVTPFQNSGITKYVYTPSVIPMALDDWPTLSQMILTQQRVVVFMDYDADQTKVSWILDEFSQMWETPYNPTTNTFPCIVQRPPGLNDTQAKDRMYLLNNNLNTEITLLGESILVPTTTLLNVTNAASGNGSLGESSKGCYEDWGRAPNFLDVDYYNVGSGSVFEVAAKWNNVTYSRTCCGTDSSVSAGERTLEIAGRTWITMCALVVLSCWMLT